MRVVVTKMGDVPFWFEILGHAPDDKLCASFSTVKHILETGVRDKWNMACLLEESDGNFMLGILKEDINKQPVFLSLMADTLQALCEDNGIAFEEVAL